MKVTELNFQNNDSYYHLQFCGIFMPNIYKSFKSWASIYYVDPETL